MSEYQDHGGALAGACIFSAVVLVAVLCKLYLGELVSFIAGLGSALLGALPEVFAGVVIGGVVVACLSCSLGSLASASKSDNVELPRCQRTSARSRLWRLRRCGG
jgi:hypothetical protein